MEKEYLLKKMRTFHCKRGHPNCDRCKELYDEGEKYCILEMPKDTGMVSRPVAVIKRAGTEMFIEFEFYKCFKTKQEALDVSKNMNIVITDID